jgi:16S rRNA (cytidine1402-2'-O)-methyltransferase
MAILYIIATPIGNMEDVSFRAVRILQETDVLACEDTRVTVQILHRYNIRKPSQLFSYHEHNEEASAEKIVRILEAGSNVALCSDAGLPSISDPGFRAVQKAVAAGYQVEVIPGPSAVQTALVVSGLPTSSYLFKGFAPRKSGQRRNFFLPEVELPHTLVFFETKYRIVEFLKDALAVYSDRKCAVCLELTKKFETIYRGYISEVITQLESETIKGEITVVIAGKHHKFIRTADDEES